MKDPTLYMQHRASGNYATCIFDDNGGCKFWTWTKNPNQAYAFQSRAEAKLVLHETFKNNTLDDVTFRRLR
jgi:hypothetical protein